MLKSYSANPESINSGEDFDLGQEEEKESVRFDQPSAENAENEVSSRNYLHLRRIDLD